MIICIGSKRKGGEAHRKPVCNLDHSFTSLMYAGTGTTRRGQRAEANRRLSEEVALIVSGEEIIVYPLEAVDGGKVTEVKYRQLSPVGRQSELQVDSLRCAVEKGGS